MTDIYTSNNAIIDNFDMGALDADSKRVNPATGEENQYFNIGIFYQLGSRVDQSAYNLESAKQRWDTAATAAANEGEINGNESVQFAILSARAAQAEAHHANAKMFYDLDVDLFNCVSGFTWQAGAKIKGDTYGRKWYAKEKEARQTKRVLAPAAPTAEEIAARKAEMIKRRAA